ncbi:EamA/RhaT family transporter [Xylophilus rhododendri]|uniref:EamA/RhaT family transporter n=1 Tax=Xylophilus rhododendri TaxID=2697032 RepID=A0A857JCK2_9BURK|nr:DMT family transporter [Xylophilus rhododendri]QHJ01725.1 EamA/RhaT family transporter [Xylophilus rhododendri]
MIVSSLLFAVMGVCVKKGSLAFTSAELVFWRGIISMVVIGLLARAQGVSLKTRHGKLHASRSLVGGFSMGTWFYCMAAVPLAGAMTLNYLSSVWVALFLVGAGFVAYLGGGRESEGRMLLGQLALLATVVAGFSGVVMILRPSADPQSLIPTLSGLLSGLLAAFAYLQVVALSRVGEPEIRVVFYYAVASAVLGALWMLFTGISEWHWSNAIWLLLIGFCSAFAQLSLTRAYGSARSHVETLVVANLQYFGILFAVMFGMWFLGEQIDALGWTGIAIVIGSSVAATLIRDRMFPKAPVEEH